MGGSKLAAAVLGTWARAPKAARDDYELYIASVSALLGGEAGAEEVQEAAAAAYGVLKTAPPVAKLKGRGSVSALHPVRYAEEYVAVQFPCQTPLTALSTDCVHISSLPRW